MEIKQLTKQSVHKICSGQVILNLATAVKELIENSIDAKATVVDIRLKEYGLKQITVIDNGVGVHPTDFQSLALKHHTSKLITFADLISVDTFGFRGEALSSLCSMSEFSMTTRHISQACGSHITFDADGKVGEINPVARQVGTTVILNDLFRTLPVRYKEFKRNVKKEFSKMIQLISAYCLVSTNVKITCTNESEKGCKSVLVSTRGNQTVKDNISSLFGPKQLSSLLEITEKILPTSSDDGESFELAMEMFKIYGFISSCKHGCGRSTTDRQFYYVNSRPCDQLKVAKAVNEIYHQYNRYQYPFVFLNITVAKDYVDINVTPDKRMMFVENEKSLISLLKAALVSLYKNIPATYEVQNDGLLTSQLSKERQLKLTTIFPSENINSNDLSNRKRLTVDNSIEHSAAKQRKNHTRQEIDAWFDEIEDVSDIECNLKNVDCFQFTKDELECPSASDRNFENLELNKNKRREMPEMPSSVTLDLQLARDIIVDTDEIIDSASRRKVANITTNIDEIRKNCRVNDAYVGDSKIILKNEFHAEIDPSKNKQAEEELSAKITKDMFSEMRIVGQFNLGFIVAQSNDNLFIIDQHASDEKYNFEILQRVTKLKTQKLVQPQSLELTAVNENKLLENIVVFQRNGFELNYDPSAAVTKRFKLTAIPVSKMWHFGKEDIDELLFMLESDSCNTNFRPSRIRAMFASRACRKSVMIGTALHHSEMKKIVANMGEIEQPWNCPHGRPTMRHLINLRILR